MELVVQNRRLLRARLIAGANSRPDQGARQRNLIEEAFISLQTVEAHVDEWILALWIGHPL